MKRPIKQTTSRRATPNPQTSLDRAERAATSAARELGGAPELELADHGQLDSVVRTIARRVASTQSRLTGGNTLETMARLKQDSLLTAPIVADGATGAAVGAGGAKLKDALDKVEASMLNDIFQTEKSRLNDYMTYHQIYELITQASEAVQTYCDNIISPDDFTKRDLQAFYEGPHGDEVDTEVRKRCRDLIDKYRLEDRVEEAITKSLVKGDFFAVVLNLRQELEGLLTEDGTTPVATLIESRHLPSPEDPDLVALSEYARELFPKDDPDSETARVRRDLAGYLNEFVSLREDTGHIAARPGVAGIGLDLPVAARRRARAPKADASLKGSGVRGSVLKLVPPENVIKLYQDDVVFGYYFIELSGPDIADFARRGNMDQTAVVRAIDQNLSARSLGADSRTGADRGKDALIGRVIVRTLAAKLGSVEFLKDNEEFAHDAYAVLSRARREKRRVTFTYVAPDQMVHFTPTGASGYGESVLSRVKFLAKLYLGAMTNAFMRNSIRRPERLVWYIDTGVDNDGNNAIQNFIRTIKQREVKFSSLRDITTTINQIGEFHDFYIPTYNGERPVEVETLNMGGASEVDSPFLEYLRKAIIGGMGVPAAFVGYSEEVAFARSLTMDNGRFLRRVVRHQKHYGRAASRLLQALYRNEYCDLEALTGTAPEKKPADKGGDSRVRKDKDASTPENLLEEIDPFSIVVRYPSPATLNMTNLSEAITQGTGVFDFVVETLTTGETDDTKAEFKKRVIADMMPQINWERYGEMLTTARLAGERKKAVETPENGGAADSGDDADGGLGDA